MKLSMFCTNCGAQISDESKFCKKCGYQIEKDGNLSVVSVHDEELMDKKSQAILTDIPTNLVRNSWFTVIGIILFFWVLFYNLLE